MNTELSGQEFNSMFDELLDDVVRGSVEQTYDYETLNMDYIESIEGLIEDLLGDNEELEEEPVQEEIEEELEQEEQDDQDDQGVTGNSNLANEILDALELERGHEVTTTFSFVGNEGEPVQEEPADQGVTDNENDVHEHQFTIIMGTNNEEMLSRFERATNQLLLELVEPEQVDVVIFHLLSEQEQGRVINHNVARLSFVDLRSMVLDIENMWSESEEHGVSVEQYLQQDLSEGIPTEEEVEPEPVEEDELEEDTNEPIYDEFGDEFDDILDEVVMESVEVEVGNDVEYQTDEEYENTFTIVFVFENIDLRGRLERSIESLELIEGKRNTDVIVYHLLEEDKRVSVREHKVASLNRYDARILSERLELIRIALQRDGITASEYLEVDVTDGIPFNEPLEEDEPVVEEEQQPVRRRRSSSGNDYTLAWDIYSLGYASGDVAYVYNLSAGSITRGMKDLGNEMRTGAETRAMRKVDPDEFSQELLDRIFNLLEEKYETEEERNTAFYNTFNKNIYELTLHEAEDESLELQEMQEQANIQGVTLQDYVSQGLAEEVYEERERSEFVNNVRYLHETVKDKVRYMFGDVNVDVGTVDVESKVSYENGVILTLKDSYKLDGKALDVSNVVFGVQIAEFIVQEFEREIEELINEMGRITRERFNNHSQVTRLGNRLVVGLDNE